MPHDYTQISISESQSRRSFFWSICVLSAMAKAVPAEARGRVRLRAGGISRGTQIPSGTKLLSRNELRECIATEKQSSVHSTEIDEIEKRITKQSDEIEKLNRQINLLKIKIDPYNEDDIKKYNFLIKRQQNLVSDYNSMLPKFNEKIKIQNEINKSFNLKCANKSYHADDMTYLKSEK